MCVYCREDDHHLTGTQYHHRKYCVDYQIYLDAWAERNELDITDFHAYYDTTGNSRTAKNLRNKTKVILAKNKSFTPDAVYYIENEHRENNLHLFELYNGKDAKYIIKQLDQHAEAMAFGQVHEKYELPKKKPYKVIVLFTYNGAMNGVIKKAKNDPRFSHFAKYFLCKNLEASDIESENFFDNWLDLYGNKASFY